MLFYCFLTGNILSASRRCMDNAPTITRACERYPEVTFTGINIGEWLDNNSNV